jgi:hypothetical protein
MKEQAMIKPIKIIKKPEIKKVSIEGKKMMAKIFTCNDGKEYTLTELSKATSIPLSTLSYRLMKYSWQSEMILFPENIKTREEMININEWERMSEKARRNNLIKLKPPGSWERSQNKHSKR